MTLQFWLLLLSFVIISLIFLMWLLLRHRQILAELANQRLALENQEAQSHRLQTLLDKSVTLLSTKDPLAYQAVQVMESLDSSLNSEPFNPSDEAEAERIAMRDGYTMENMGVNDFDSEFLRAAANPEYGFSAG